MKSRNRTTITATQRLQLTLGLAASIRVLRQDASGLAMYLEEQAAENPHLRLERADPPPGEWLPRWSRVFADAGGIDRAPAAGPSLMGHVMAAIDRMFPGGADRKAAVTIAQALEPSGWLGRPLADLAAEAGVPVAVAETVLQRLQDIEPPGLFARNLAECLALQLREAGWLDPPMQAILSRLDLLAAGSVAHARLARIAGVDVDGIVLRQRRIRGLNPKPGTLFDEGAAPVREPDLVAVRRDGAWTLALNRSALPAIRIQPDVPSGGADRLSAAREIARHVEARGATILRVGQEVLRRQAAVLDRGMAALVPMTMAEVAAAVDLHVSTVSRAVAGASVDTPSGTWWLRHFFTQGMRHRSGGDAADSTGPSAGALRAEIARLVSAEDPAAPLTDAALAAALERIFGPPGPVRRTVAKYRDILSIPPAHRRRRKG